MCDCFMDTDTRMTYNGGTSEEVVDGWRGLSEQGTTVQCEVCCFR